MNENPLAAIQRYGQAIWRGLFPASLLDIISRIVLP
jgi:hypothetical protein